MTRWRIIGLVLMLLAPAAPAGAKPWDDFQIIMWADQTPAQMLALRSLGIHTLRVNGSRNAPLDPEEIHTRLAPIQAAGLGIYVENIATDFYAPYHRYSPDHPGQPNWLFDQARARYRANPKEFTVLRREPSLSDDVWQSRIRARLATHVRAFGPYQPLFYNLGDEVGIADLAAAWDFDFSSSAITQFRQAMRLMYGNLDLLNRQWDTNFTDWNDVMPDTTLAAMQRGNGNFSAWSDFRGWMDLSFAQALRLGTNAVHASRLGARAGIEGAQAPGTGGYDYSLLPFAVDVIEGTEDGEALAIARSLNPALISMTTTSGIGADEIAPIWRSLLRGARGLVIWDGAKNFIGTDGSAGPRAQALAPTFAALTGGLGAQFIASTPVADKVAILYSPPSQRIRWLLDRQPTGEAWRDAANLSEAASLDNSLYRLAVQQNAEILGRLGIRPRYLTPSLIVRGALRDTDIRLLLLPQALALSQRETDEIAAFAANGGVVAADQMPGQYDEHGRHLGAPSMLVLQRHGRLLQLPSPIAAPSPANRATITSGIVTLLTQARAEPEFRMVTTAGQPIGDVELSQFHNGDVTLLGLQRAAGTQGEEALDLVVPAGSRIYDLRQRTTLDHGLKLSLRVAPDQPTVLAISPTPLPMPMLIGPRTSQAPGSLLNWDVGLTAQSPAKTHIFHVDLLAPDGRILPNSSRNLTYTDTSIRWRVQLPSDAPGQWTARVTDILSGATVRATLDIRAP